MTTTVTVYADPVCAWAFLVLHRLRAARDHHGLDVVFDQRAWPLEWVNRTPPPPPSYFRRLTTALAADEPELFADIPNTAPLATVLPAFDLVAAARRTCGPRAAEDLTYHLGCRFFRHGADLAQPHELHQAAVDGGLPADTIMQVWCTEPVRDDVTTDYHHSQQLPIQGSPQIFWPDGSTTHNPALDRQAAARLLRSRVLAPAGHGPTLAQHPEPNPSPPR